MRSPIPLPAHAIWSVWVRVQCVTVGLRLLGFQRLCRLIRKTAASSQAPVGDSLLYAQQTAALVNRIIKGYFLFGVSCLEASIALWWILLSKGIISDLRLGVRTITGRFESHAWVEYEGNVLNDLEAISVIYTPMPLNIFPPGMYHERICRHHS
jgi:hypothetical protein